MAWCRYCSVDHKYICDCSLKHIDKPALHGMHIQGGYCMVEGCDCEHYSQQMQVTVQDLEDIKVQRICDERRKLREEKKARERKRAHGYRRWLRAQRKSKRAHR